MVFPNIRVERDVSEITPEIDAVVGLTPISLKNYAASSRVSLNHFRSIEVMSPLRGYLLNKALRRLRVLQQYGLHLDQLLQLRSLCKDRVRFRQTKRQYFSMLTSSQSNGLFKQAPDFPCYSDHSRAAGDLPKHYFQQDLFVAQEVFRSSPVRHIDVGSRIDGFVAHVATFRKIEVVDIRPMNDVNQNIRFLQFDVTQKESVPHGICDSLSCLHTIEHIGLGRYGDTINPDGWLTALDNLLLMLKSGGTLYLSAPIGEGTIEFNAHRIFLLQDLLNAVSERASVVSVDLLGDDDRFMTNSECNAYIRGELPNVKYGCAIIKAIKL